MCSVRRGGGGVPRGRNGNDDDDDDDDVQFLGSRALPAPPARPALAAPGAAGNPIEL